MNVCVAHLEVNVCVAKNFGAWTEKVGHPWAKYYSLQLDESTDIGNMAILMVYVR